MKNVSRLVVVPAVAVSLILSSQSVQAARKLGGVDLQKYCSQKYREDNTYSATAKLRPEKFRNPTAYDWKCARRNEDTGKTRYYDIDMTDACRWQYNKNNVRARTDEPEDPNSWKCYTR
jgi:hypothetical protein